MNNKHNIINRRHILNLRLIRKNKGITQNQLAKQLGVDQTTITKWEKNRVKPRLDMVFKLSRVLDVDVNDIVKIFS